MYLDVSRFKMYNSDVHVLLNILDNVEYIQVGRERTLISEKKAFLTPLNLVLQNLPFNAYKLMVLRLLFYL